jgi:soluble lytic murein transglycosylase-like protein
VVGLVGGAPGRGGREVTARGRRLRAAPALLAVAAFLGGFGIGRSLLPGSPRALRALVVDATPPDLSRFDAPIERSAREFGLDADLLRGLVATESSGDPRAKSGPGAIGLLQLMPATAKERAAALRMDLSRLDLYDPETNLRVGASYFAGLLQRLGGEPAFALAAYNAGPTPVLRWRLRAPDADAREVIRREGYPETRHHVARALAYRDAYRDRRR